MQDICGRCYEEGVELFNSNCVEKPEELVGMPLGQYHCPDCGAMVIAGIKHPKMCEKCDEATAYKMARKILRPLENDPGVQPHKYQQVADNIVETLCNKRGRDENN